MLPVILATNDITPNSIGGLQLWLDATSIEQADATAVTSWRDKVSGANAVSMSTTASQPIVKNNILNGKPVVRFDGVDDYLDLTYPFDYKIYANHNACAWSTDGNYFAIGASTTSPYVAIYKRSGNSFIKLANPDVLPTGGVQKLKFSPDGNYLAVPHSASPFVTVYKRSGDIFTKIANPATLPTGTGISLAWTSDSLTLLVGSSAGTGNRLSVYSLNQSTDVLTLQSTGFTQSNALADISLSSNDANLCMVYTNASPYIELATYNKSTYAVTSLGVSQPDNIPTGAANGCAFSPDGTYLSVTHSTTPFFSVYFRSGTTYTKLANAASLPSSTGQQCSWSPDGSLLAVTHTSGPYISVYQKTGTGASATMTRLTQPATIPQNNGQGVAFSPAGGYLGVTNITSGYLTMYTYSGTTFTAITENDMLRNVSGSTIFVVARPIFDSTNDNLFSISAGSSTAYRAGIFTTTTNKLQSAYRTADADAAISLTASQTGVSNVGTIVATVIDNTTSNRTIYIDNNLGGNGSGTLTLGNTSNTNSYYIYLGKYTAAGFEYLGDIAEIIVYNKALTATEISGLNKYLGAKWGITVA